MKCDLHIHTDCSDGIFPPEKIVAMAHEKGLECIAITDHDTVCGVERAKQAAEKLDIRVVPGIEISSVGSCDVHMLAYNMDSNVPGFDEDMQRISNFRKNRNVALQQKLLEHGFEIDIESLKADGSVGRAAVARAMVEKGYCKDVPEAFEKYLGEGKSCFVRTERLTPVEAIQMALKYGGIPVLAHPKNLRLPFADFEKFLKPLVLAGLGGIEAQYFTHNKSERKFYEKMAKKYKLIVTGGSDFHDYTHGVTLGEQYFVPSAYTKKILGL